MLRIPITLTSISKGDIQTHILTLHGPKLIADKVGNVNMMTTICKKKYLIYLPKETTRDEFKGSSSRRKHNSKMKCASPAALMAIEDGDGDGDGDGVPNASSCRHATHIMNERRSMKNSLYSYTHNN